PKGALPEATGKSAPSSRDSRELAGRARHAARDPRRDRTGSRYIDVRGRLRDLLPEHERRSFRTSVDAHERPAPRSPIARNAIRARSPNSGGTVRRTGSADDVTAGAAPKKTIRFSPPRPPPGAAEC